MTILFELVEPLSKIGDSEKTELALGVLISMKFWVSEMVVFDSSFGVIVVDEAVVFGGVTLTMLLLFL